MAKNYELIKENGKIVDVKVDGKPVKRGFIRGLKKAQNTSYWRVFSDGGFAQNPFSGETVELNALEKMIYNWCANWYHNDYSRNPLKTQAPIQTYDDMKYFLLFLNSDAYMKLLD
jgi:hypothetical protein